MVQLIFPTFKYFPQYFPHCFKQGLDYHIHQLQASPNVCAHTPLTLLVSTSYITSVAKNAQEPMMQFVTYLLPLCEMRVFTWDENNYMCFPQSRSTSIVDKSKLCSLKMEFTPQLMLSLLTQHMWITSPTLHNFKMQIIEDFKLGVMIGLTISRLPPLQGTTPIAMANVLQAISY